MRVCQGQCLLNKPLLSVSQLQGNTKPLQLIFLQPLLAAAHFLSILPLSLPQVFPSGLFFPPLPPPQVLRCDSFCSFPSFLTQKHQSCPRRLHRKATQHNTLPRVWISCRLQTSQISLSANEVLGKHALPPHWGNSGAIKISPN